MEVHLWSPSRSDVPRCRSSQLRSVVRGAHAEISTSISEMKWTDIYLINLVTRFQIPDRLGTHWSCGDVSSTFLVLRVLPFCGNRELHAPLSHSSGTLRGFRSCHGRIFQDRAGRPDSGYGWHRR